VATCALAMTLIVVIGSVGGSVAWSKTITSPFTGSFSQCASGPSYLNYSASGPSFNFTSGNGTYNVTSWGGSAGASDVFNNKYVTRYFGQAPTGCIKIDVPFKNHSGARVLDQVNVTIDYSFTANYSFAPGICPWVKSTAKSNECYSVIEADAVFSGPTLSYLNGRHNFVSYESCTSGCTQSTEVSHQVYASVSERNSSKGATFANFSTNKSANVSGSVTYVITPAAPLARSGTLMLELVENFADEVQFQSKTGAGGLLGGFGFASLDFSISLISIVES
jgi:hypothetical protein